jgi:hypothetical protein
VFFEEGVKTGAAQQRCPVIPRLMRILAVAVFGCGLLGCERPSTVSVRAIGNGDCTASVLLTTFPSSAGKEPISRRLDGQSLPFETTSNLPSRGELDLTLTGTKTEKCVSLSCAFLVDGREVAHGVSKISGTDSHIHQATCRWSAP